MIDPFAPFVEFGFMRRALVGCLALSISAPPVGVFLMLRRMSLMSEAMSHAILPGAAVGFLVAGLSLPAMTLGGLVAGLAVALLAGLVTRSTVIREDASLAAFYLISLAAGVLLSGLQNMSIDIAMERSDGTLKRLGGTPLSPVSYFIGKLGQVLVTGFLQSVLLIVVAAVFFGVPLPTEPERWLTFAWVFLLGVTTCAILGIGLAVGVLLNGSIIGLFNIAGLIAAILYLVDVRPAVREIGKPGSNQGPYGAW